MKPLCDRGFVAEQKAGESEPLALIDVDRRAEYRSRREEVTRWLFVADTRDVDAGLDARVPAAFRAQLREAVDDYTQALRAEIGGDGVQRGDVFAAGLVLSQLLGLADSLAKESRR